MDMKRYEVTRIELATEKESDFGILYEEDVKLVTKGYTYNGLFYERKNGKYIFIVNEYK
jgi:hypothetical protein